MMASIFELTGRLTEASPSWILAFDVESGVLNAKADVETKSAAITVKIFIFSPKSFDVLSALKPHDVSVGLVFPRIWKSFHKGVGVELVSALVGIKKAMAVKAMAF